jgi:glycosyltransferase involved in cell wall biosynthesis
LFAGNIYDNTYQPEANRVLSEKLNALGKGVADHGIRVYFLGIGDVSLLDPRWVTNLGSVSYEESWDYLRFASVGIVVSAGSFMHNNESSKIYHYLRAGLPVVSEEGFPNDHVVRDSGRGFVVPSGDMEAMAARICQAAAIEAGRQRAIDFVIREHSWDRRVETYEPVLPVQSAPWWRRLRGL